MYRAYVGGKRSEEVEILKICLLQNPSDLACPSELTLRYRYVAWSLTKFGQRSGGLGASPITQLTARAEAQRRGTNGIQHVSTRGHARITHQVIMGLVTSSGSVLFSCLGSIDQGSRIQLHYYCHCSSSSGAFSPARVGEKRGLWEAGA
jgi:hypothetical protein